MRRPHPIHELLDVLRRLRRTRRGKDAVLRRVRLARRARYSQAVLQRLRTASQTRRHASRRRVRFHFGDEEKRRRPRRRRLEPILTRRTRRPKIHDAQVQRHDHRVRQSHHRRSGPRLPVTRIRKARQPQIPNRRPNRPNAQSRPHAPIKNLPAQKRLLSADVAAQSPSPNRTRKITSARIPVSALGHPIHVTYVLGHHTRGLDSAFVSKRQENKSAYPRGRPPPHTPAARNPPGITSLRNWHAQSP